MKPYLVASLFVALAAGFWASSAFETIAAGVAIFVFGMLLLEDGFRLVGGGLLERVLARATDSTPKAIGFGIVSTALMQSSSLVSLLSISFLSAGLIELAAGIGIVFGANLGTTTGAWLIAGPGLRIDLARFAMPILVFGVVLAFGDEKRRKGFGHVLTGIGFLFLGIHFMKTGFDGFQQHIDLTRYAIPGLAGLLVYTLIGVAATLVMQSSHATMLLTITALAAGQIVYANALALTIGANLGTTITAIIGSISANFQGRRLALAHLLFNGVTAVVALVLIVPLVAAVDRIATLMGIAADDHALKLAVFHTLFNLIGLAIMVPALRHMIRFLERVVPRPLPDLSKPRYLDSVVDMFPATMETALARETEHLYENAVEILAHGLNLHRHVIFGSSRLAADVAASRQPIDFDLDERYENRVKSLYAAIVSFSTRVAARELPESSAARVYSLRDAAIGIVRAVKAVKHLRRNMLEYTTRPRGAVTRLYNELRLDIARLMAEIGRISAMSSSESASSPDEVAKRGQWIDEQTAIATQARASLAKRVDALIRAGSLDAQEATSYLNDSGYALEATVDLLAYVRIMYGGGPAAVTPEVARVGDTVALPGTAEGAPVDDDDFR